MKYYIVPAILKQNENQLYQWYPSTVYIEYGDINCEEQKCVISTEEILEYPEVDAINQINKLIK